ncbi:hypothetical protein N431DRAFT_378299 [Stipitochalara longipes BDJ]|nr:hypothetical protein N431DRAFT_378299 [Stipitochalara longipes BDJ]
MENSLDDEVVMSDLTASLWGYPSSQTQVNQQPSETMKPGVGHHMVPYMGESTRPRSIFDSEWSQFERLIRHLYIEKDQSLKAVQRYLREKHGLIVTEKQLTRRFSKWNLKKNVKAREKKALIQEYRLNQDKEWTGEGRGKVTAKKLIRWEKEQATSSKPNLYLCLNETSGVSTTILDERVKATTLQISEQMEQLRNGIDPTLYGEEDPTILIAQLFTKLDLDVPTDIYSYQVETKTGEETKTSDSNLVSFESIHTSVPFGTSSCTTVIIRPSTAYPRLEFAANKQGLPFRWDNMDFMLSTGVCVQPSPYNELYPFSSATPNAQKSSVSSIEANFQSIFDTFPSSVDSKIQERLCKIEKLRQLCPANHRGLIVEIMEVILMYWHEKKYHETEYWCRQLDLCPPSADAEVQKRLIFSRMMLSITLWRQRKLKEARREHQTTHQLVLSSSDVSEDIMAFSLYTGGIISEDCNQDEDSEFWFRQLAQLRLTTYGPRSEDTISYLRYLAEAMVNQRRYSESEELLWIIIDLAKTRLKSTGRVTIKLACSLARLMFKQKRFGDAENLWRMSLGIAETQWGSEDSITLKAETGLARVLKSQGRLAESETLLRCNVEKLVRKRGQDSLTACVPMEYLASLLMQDSRYEDATIWWEKCSKIRRLKFGPTDNTAFEAFSMLGECYLQLGRYSDALDLGQEWLEAIKKVSGLGHEYVSQLQSWLEAIVAENVPDS